MGKKKDAKRREDAAANAQAEAAVLGAARPPTEPWSTSLGSGRWALHQTSVPIVVDDGSEDGQKDRVRGTLDTTGAPELSAAFIERIDQGIMRPAFTAYLHGPFRSESSLAPLLPLSPVEAMSLLRARESDLSFIVGQCAPIGPLSAGEVGERFVPPVHADIITGRRARALAMLGVWTTGSSYRPKVSRSGRMPDMGDP